MPCVRLVILMGVALVSLVSTAGAQVTSSADQVRSLYRKFLNREPSSNELTQWVWAFQKGLSLTDAQVTFLGADEYYARYARNPSSYVTGLYADVLNRAPSSNEVSAWVERLNVTFRGDREKLVGEFLAAVERDAAQRAPLPTAPPASAPSPPALPRLEEQLVALARLARDAVETELGGTAQGRQLALLSSNLVAASSQLARMTTATTSEAAQAYQDLRAARTALDQDLRPVQVAAPNVTAYLDRFDRLLVTLPVAASVPAALPAAPTTSASTAQRDARWYQEVLRAHQLTARDTEQLLYVLRSMDSPDAFHGQLLRDIQYFSSQLDALDQSLRWDVPSAEVRSHVLRLRVLGAGVSEQMRREAPASQVLQRWNIVTQDLQQLSRAVGLGTGMAIDPGAPVLFNAPTYYQLPYQVQRPAPVHVPADALPLIDQTVAQLNAFVVGFNQFLPYYPQVPGLQAHARRLRLSLLQFRQELAGSGTPQGLKTRLAEINQALDALVASWKQTIQATGLKNAPEISDILVSLQKANQVFLQATLPD